MLIIRFASPMRAYNDLPHSAKNSSSVSQGIVNGLARAPGLDDVALHKNAR